MSVTYLSVCPRMVRALALALFVFLANNASADSLDIVIGALQVRYVGSVLSIDQLPTAAEVHFDATERNIVPWPQAPLLTQRWFYAPWRVVVGSNVGVPEFASVHCLFGSQTYLQGAGMHIVLHCLGDVR